MIRKVTSSIAFLSFFILMVITLSQFDVVSAAKGGAPGKPTSPLTSPKPPKNHPTSPRGHGNPHEATFNGVTRIFNID